MAEDLPGLTMSQIQDLAGSMSKSATNLYRLLENLLQWSRMQQGAISFNPAVVQLRTLVDESLEMIQGSATDKGIEIETDIPLDLKAFADSNMLQTVIRNLISNAIKFSSKGAKVNITAKATIDNNIEISIHDTGIGMSKAMIEDLFQIDIQTGRKGTDGEPSTGLGLILCKEFVEKHNGKIWVESEEGKGSIFYFTLTRN
jgi:signal transduction histidine kinase